MYDWITRGCFVPVSSANRSRPLVVPTAKFAIEAKEKDLGNQYVPNDERGTVEQFNASE
jgi:hypothetical protein